MPLDIRLSAANVLPNALLSVDSVRSHFAFHDLIALSGNHDFLLQASNQMCATAAFSSVQLPWITGRLDAEAVSALRASGATFTSAALQRAVAAPVGITGTATDTLVLFGAHDVQFDAVNQCRIRFSVRVALGSMFVVPREPGLVRGLTPGEAVQQAVNPARVVDPMRRVAQTMLAVGNELTADPPVMRTLSDNRTGNIMDSRAALEIDRYPTIRDLDPHIDLGDRSSFDVSAWLGDGFLEIAAPFGATGDQSSKTIRVAADVQQSNAHFTGLSHDAALLLSDADPTGLVLATTKRVRQRGSVALLDDVSVLGAPANARAGHLGPLVADTFPCSTGACAVNVSAIVVAGRTASRVAIPFIGSSRYGVVWSADAVKMLVRYCWEIGAFPRGITQTQIDAVLLKVDGVKQKADAISVFQLDTLDVIELEYDSNGRRDVLYTGGFAQVVPKLIRLKDGTEFAQKDADDPLFAPSDKIRWTALGELTEQPLSASPDLLLFEKTVTSGVTSRLGRPFTDPPFDAVVTDSRVSAPAQRVGLIIN